MRHIFHLLLLCSSLSFGQVEICEGVEKTIKELEGYTEYVLIGEYKYSNIKFSRHVEDGIDFKNVMFSTEIDHPYYDLKGLFFKLSNGKILRFEKVKISCSYIKGDIYLLYGSVLVNDSLYKDLLENEILQFSLGGYNDTPSYAFRKNQSDLIKCMFED